MKKSLQIIVYSVLFTEYNIECTLYGYGVQCKVYIVQHTIFMLLTKAKEVVIWGLGSQNTGTKFNVYFK